MRIRLDENTGVRLKTHVQEWTLKFLVLQHCIGYMGSSDTTIYILLRVELRKTHKKVFFSGRTTKVQEPPPPLDLVVQNRSFYNFFYRWEMA